MRKHCPCGVFGAPEWSILPAMQRPKSIPNLAVLAPGYGGGPEQQILQALAKRLAEAGFVSQAVAFSTQGRRPSKGYASEIVDLKKVRESLLAGSSGKVALVGRSFGGRMCTFLAAKETPEALAVLGYPVAPPGRPRPDDEAALLSLKCPTLIVQGSRDELGPVEVLERLAARNPLIRLHVVPGAGHGFGKQEPAAIAAVVAWLQETMAA